MGQVINALSDPLIPDINGITYDFSSAEITFQGTGLGIVEGIVAINYKDSLTPDEARGTAPQFLGRGRGPYKAEGDIELFKFPMQALIAALGQIGALRNLGYKEVPFDIKLDYGDIGQPVITDVMRGCRMVENSQSHKNDQKILTEKATLSVAYLIRNGQYPYSPGTGGPAKFFP